jgi:tetratricopeptide (TPR) repeat protein
MPFTIRLENALIAYVAYIGKMIWPRNLAVLYPYSESSLPSLAKAVGAALLLTLISALVIRAARKRPHLPVGWFWYLGTLVPVIGLVQVGEQTMADRYTYIPLIGLFVAIAWALPGERVPGRKAAGRVLAGFCVLILALLGIAARAQLACWKDSVTLFERTLSVTKDNYSGHLELALAYADAGRTDDAIWQYREAIRIMPSVTDAHLNLAILLYNKGDYAGAWEQVHICGRLGLQPNSDFVADLDRAMPEPVE